MSSPRDRNSPTHSTVYMVSCVKQKRERKCAARDLYMSDWFLKARNYVESFPCAWFVLSAEYGLVRPHRMIAPYEQTLNRMSKLERLAWAKSVVQQVDTEISDLSHVVFLAGMRYREFLAPHFENCGVRVSIPMEHLRIGKQKRWLKQHEPSSASDLYVKSSGVERSGVAPG